jgi:hypothetical protein
MKRILLLAMIVLLATACKKVTPETRIAQISDFFDGKEAVYSAKLQQYAGDKKLDYLTLQLAGELGAKDIWTLEDDGGNSLVAEFPGKEKDNPQISMISAPLDDPTACALILEVLEAYHTIKIQHKNTIRAVFYAPAPDSTRPSGLASVNEDLHESGEFNSFDIELATRKDQPQHTFFLSENPTFVEKLIQIIPGYLAPLGDYQVEPETDPDPNWPLKGSIYRYYINPNEFQKEAAAVTAFSFLLN